MLKPIEKRDLLLPTKIHGRVKLPEGYSLAIVPRDAQFVDDSNTSLPKSLSSDYSIVKILAAIAQLLFAVATLYRTRADQISRFGYAAFGLTVTQYALMSFINLLGNLLCPQYSTTYLVESGVMREAKDLPGAIFEGAVGSLVEDVSDQSRDERRPMKFWLAALKRIWWLPIAWIPTVVSIIIIWRLSRFQKGQSTTHQRWLTMTWLALGSYVGALTVSVPSVNYTRAGVRNAFLLAIFLMLVILTPIVAAMWVVVMEIKDYGICYRVT